MGTVVLSVDAELAWGFHDIARPNRERIRTAKSGWDTVIGLLETYNMPATWAVVGALMLEGWADHTDRTHSDRWFAPALIDDILTSELDHEIASHTYSHLCLAHDSVTAEQFRAELEQHRALANERGITLETLVYPRNEIRFRDIVAETGFRGYRGRHPRAWYDSGSVRPLGKTISLLTGRSAAPLVEPDRDEFDLVNVPASLYLYGFDWGPLGPTPLGHVDPIVSAVRRALASLSMTDAVFHLWLHPNNLQGRRERTRLRDVLEAIAAARRTGHVTVEPMRSVMDSHEH